VIPAWLKRRVEVQRGTFVVGLAFALLQPEGPSVGVGLGRVSIVLYWRAQG
jgi:hypothetical protein